MNLKVCARTLIRSRHHANSITVCTGYIVISVRTPIPVFLLIKTMFFRLIFSIYYLLTLLPSAHIIAGWLLRYTSHRLYCLSAQATLTCPEHGFIFEG
nr:MAG TPA: hypothetical protein [Caudoviricetes sp.]